MNAFESLPAVALRISRETPERVAFTFVDDSGKESAILTYSQICKRAQQIGGELLAKHGLQKGDRVLLVYPQGLEFTEAFFACLWVGLIPVPAPAPIPEIAADCKAKAQLTSQAYLRSRTFARILQVFKIGPKWPELPWIVTDSMDGNDAPLALSPSETDLAFLQYTSGSTRAPRGVQVSFGNIFNQNRLISEEIKTGQSNSVALFWMPHYHDFTLVGGIIHALCGYVHFVSFSTGGFLRRPALWGELMHRYRATHIGGPDFAYRLFTLHTKPEQRAQWDLSSVVAAICAAEPIRPKTVDAFLEAFAVSKLAPSSFCPAYGLAEHTLAVTLHGRKRFKIRKDPESETVSEVMGCGRVNPEVAVKIVDPDQCVEVPNGKFGEIWVDSKSKTLGYVGEEERSLKFHGKLPGSDCHWLRTGDQGAMMEGELIVLGRLDDMVIIRGKNIYPQDVEGVTSDCDTRVRPGRVVSFGTQDEEPKLVVVLELKESEQSAEAMSAVAIAARTQLQQELGVANAILVFVKPGSIPKTTSGKLQRNRCRTLWVSGELEIMKEDRGLGIS